MSTHDDLMRRNDLAVGIRHLADDLVQMATADGDCHRELKNVNIQFSAAGIMVRATVRTSRFIRTRSTSEEYQRLESELAE